jgi:DNA-binding beta-propeller fold protein YncE
MWLIVGGMGNGEQKPSDNAPPKPKLARVIPLPGVGGPVVSSGIRGRIDHLAYDPATHRLFVAALENGSLEIVDLDKGERIKSITGLSHPQGIGLVAATGEVVLACGGDGTIHVFDAKTLQPRLTVEVGENADNVRVDARAARIYVGCGGEAPGSLIVFDARSFKKVGEVILRLRPESFQLDLSGKRIFVNLPGPKKADTNGFIAVANRETGQTEATWELKNRARNFPLAFDPQHDRVFVACRKPAKLVALNAKSGQVLSEADCVLDSDDLFLDDKTGRVIVIGGGTRADDANPPIATQPAGVPNLVSDGEGAASDLFQVAPAGKLKAISSVATAPHARTGLFVPDRRAVYVAVPPRAGGDSEVWEYTLPD